MKEQEDAIRIYLEERGWDELRPGDLAKSISIEAAGLLEVFQWTNPSLDEVSKDLEKVERIKKELADVLIYTLEISILLKLDTVQIIESKLQAAREKYPAHLFKDRDRSVEAGSEDVYWDIKKQHRTNRE